MTYTVSENVKIKINSFEKYVQSTKIGGYHFVNLTPHTIDVVNEDRRISFYPSKIVARVDVVRTQQHTSELAELLNFHSAEFGNVVGLPELTLDTSGNMVIFIVSGMVFDAMPDRYDIVAPGDLVRNPQGQPIGCNGLRVRK